MSQLTPELKRIDSYLRVVVYDYGEGKSNSSLCRDREEVGNDAILATLHGVDYKVFKAPIGEWKEVEQ